MILNCKGTEYFVENIMDKMDLDKARAFLKECGENIISLRDVKSKAKNMAKTLILNYSV